MSSVPVRVGGETPSAISSTVVGSAPSAVKGAEALLALLDSTAPGAGGVAGAKRQAPSAPARFTAKKRKNKRTKKADAKKADAKKVCANSACASGFERAAKKRKKKAGAISAGASSVERAAKKRKKKAGASSAGASSVGASSAGASSKAKKKRNEKNLFVLFMHKALGWWTKTGGKTLVGGNPKYPVWAAARGAQDLAAKHALFFGDGEVLSKAIGLFFPDKAAREAYVTDKVGSKAWTGDTYVQAINKVVDTMNARGVLQGFCERTHKDFEKRGQLAMLLN
jgi:hypothetical protein